MMFRYLLKMSYPGKLDDLLSDLDIIVKENTPIDICKEKLKEMLIEEFNSPEDMYKINYTFNPPEDDDFEDEDKEFEGKNYIENVSVK